MSSERTALERLQQQRRNLFRSPEASSVSASDFNIGRAYRAHTERGQQPSWASFAIAPQEPRPQDLDHPQEEEEEPNDADEDEDEEEDDEVVEHRHQSDSDGGLTTDGSETMEILQRVAQSRANQHQWEQAASARASLMDRANAVARDHQESQHRHNPAGGRQQLPIGSGLRHSYSTPPTASISTAAAPVSPQGKGGATIDELLRCFICYSRTRQPHLCPACSKIGCRACYVTWIEKSSSCPFCRAQLTVHSLVNCRFMGDMERALTDLGVSLDGASASNVAAASVCPTHPTQPLSYWCQTCSEPLCSDCAMFDSRHRSHEFAKLDAIYTEHVSLIRLELDALRNRLQLMDHARASLESQVGQLTRKKEEHSKDAQAFLHEIEAGLMAELKKKLVGILAKKNEIATETGVLSRLVLDLTHQLNPSNLPKHELIQRTHEIISHVYELHQKPLSFGSSSADADGDLGLGLAFSNEVVPPFNASPLVRVTGFQRRRREAQEEEEHIKQCKLAHTQQAALVDSPDEAALAALPPVPTPTHEVLFSSPMLINGQTWRLKLYLNGNGIARGTYLSLFVELTASQLQQPVTPLEDQELETPSDTEAPDAAAAAFPIGPPRPLPAAPTNASKYEYRVEMLPHPRLYPRLAEVLSLDLLESISHSSPLASQTVASYIEQLQYEHALDEELCNALRQYGSKIVSRVFSSAYEPGESWGYNRFTRIDTLQEDGYLASPSPVRVAAAADDDEQKSSGGDSSLPAAAASSSSPDHADDDDGDLLFRFYVRPPTFHLQCYEQRAWIAQLEQHSRAQAKEIARLKRQLPKSAASSTATAATSTAPRVDTTSTLPKPSQSTGALTIAPAPRSTLPLRAPSSSASLAAAPPRSLSSAEIMHAISTQPAATIPTIQHALQSRPLAIVHDVPVAAVAPIVAAPSVSPPSSSSSSVVTSAVQSRSPSAHIPPPHLRMSSNSISEVLRLHHDSSDSDGDTYIDRSSQLRPDTIAPSRRSPYFPGEAAASSRHTPPLMTRSTDAPHAVARVPSLERSDVESGGSESDSGSDRPPEPPVRPDFSALSVASSLLGTLPNNHSSSSVHPPLESFSRLSAVSASAIARIAAASSPSASTATNADVAPVPPVKLSEQ